MTTGGATGLLDRPLVLGLGVTGAAVVRALRRRGVDVLVVDDHPDRVASAASDLEVSLTPAPSDDDGWSRLLGGVSVLLPSPGVPDAHPAVRAARAGAAPVRSEFDLAAAWDDRPLLAITGTNGKTTVTSLTASILRAAGKRAVEAGNTDVPLVEAIDDPDADVFVVEASSFRLGHAHRFSPAVGTWLNLAPDHLDVHASLEDYEAAKAGVWAALPADGVAVANADDPGVLRHLPEDRAHVTFGLGGRSSGADWTVEGGQLVDPAGDRLAAVDELSRSLPHDVANALAAAATAVSGGADLAAARTGVLGFTGLAHRVEQVASVGGVTWWDDSKATTPHATVAAVAGFDSVVLIAGGRNKGIDLAPLGTAADHVRAVVAIGEAAEDVVAAFAGRRPVTVAASMAEAVQLAADVATPGDAVVLSPGCASFDWYRSYGERGDAFAAEVRRQLRIDDLGRSRR